MKTLLLFSLAQFALAILLVVVANAQSNQTNVLQTKRIWDDGREYPTYTAIYLFPNKEKQFPRCDEFDLAKIKKEYTENVTWIKQKYPNAKFREVVIQYAPSRHEVELTFDQLKEIACK